MSDTLRTDTLLIIHDMDPEPKVLINHARALERALNNADARIKQLEEAGNNLLWNFCPEYTSDLTHEQSDALKQWNKAKKDNP